MYAGTGNRVLRELFYYISVEVGEAGAAVSTQEGNTDPWKPVDM